MKYKIDNIPVKEFQIKFIATLENGETIDLSRVYHNIGKINLGEYVAFGKFSERCCKIMFGKDGNLPLSEIEDYAEFMQSCT